MQLWIPFTIPHVIIVTSRFPVIEYTKITVSIIQMMGILPKTHVKFFGLVLGNIDKETKLAAP